VPEDSSDDQRIGLCPAAGYGNSNNQSKEALNYFRWYQHSKNKDPGTNIQLRTSESTDGELHVPGVGDVDAFYEDADGKKVILEYQGCFFESA
jgi:hypothetical protein